MLARAARRMHYVCRTVSRLVALGVSIALLAGCEAGPEAGSEARLEGEAFLLNGTGEDGMRVVVRRPDDVRQEGGLLEDLYSFDTQFPDRELQCYVASDGYFEVIRADGSVFVHHEFADRPVCDKEEITLEADGDLVWVD